VWLVYYNPGGNQPPNAPTLISPANESTVNTAQVTFTWINNGDPDGDAVGSWLYLVGPYGQVISKDIGAAGFVENQEIQAQAVIYAGQEWAWTVYIYDPGYNSDPYYNFQQPFWKFTTTN